MEQVFQNKLCGEKPISQWIELLQAADEEVKRVQKVYNAVRKHCLPVLFLTLIAFITWLFSSKKDTFTNVATVLVFIASLRPMFFAIKHAQKAFVGCLSVLLAFLMAMVVVSMGQKPTMIVIWICLLLDVFFNIIAYKHMRVLPDYKEVSQDFLKDIYGWLFFFRENIKKNRPLKIEYKPQQNDKIDEEILSNQRRRKVTQYTYHTPFISGQVALIDTTKLRWSIEIIKKERQIRKVNPRGKTKYKSKFKGSVQIRANLSFPKNKYSLQKKEETLSNEKVLDLLRRHPQSNHVSDWQVTDKVKYKEKDETFSISICRTIKCASFRGEVFSKLVTLPDFIDVVAVGYQQVQKVSV